MHHKPHYLWFLFIFSSCAWEIQAAYALLRNETSYTVFFADHQPHINWPLEPSTEVLIKIGWGSFDIKFSAMRSIQLSCSELHLFYEKDSSHHQGPSLRLDRLLRSLKPESTRTSKLLDDVDRNDLQPTTSYIDTRLPLLIARTHPQGLGPCFLKNISPLESDTPQRITLQELVVKCSQGTISLIAPAILGAAALRSGLKYSGSWVTRADGTPKFNEKALHPHAQ